MVYDKDVEMMRECGNVRMTEFVEATFLPLDSNSRVLFLKPLCGCDQRWQGSAVVPRDPAQQDLVHIGCSWSSDATRTLLPLFAERHAASITSIAATPRVAGD